MIFCMLIHVEFMEIKSLLRNIGVGGAKNGFDHRTLKLVISEEGIDGIN